MKKRSSKKLRIAVAGLGRIGWDFHCKTIGSHRDWQLVAVADPDAARRKEAEEKFGCHPFATFEQMLAGGNLDAVAIASPTHFHKAHAVAALGCGLHVMLEKPMATSYKDAQTIVRAAEKAKRILTVYQPNRAAAYFQQMLKIVAAGKIGQIYHVRRGVFRFVRRDDWQSLTKYGGGMLNNYGAHGLDQTLALTGADVKKVFCNLRRVASLGDAEDVVKVVYETRTGAIGEIDINQATLLAPYEFEIYGSKGVLSKQKDELTIRYLSPKQFKAKKLDTSLASQNRLYPSDDDIQATTEVIVVDPKYAVNVYTDLARAIRTGKEPLVPARTTLEVVRIMEMCRKDSKRITQTPLS